MGRGAVELWVVRTTSEEATMVQAEAKLTREGQVTIPHEIREAMHAKEGDTLVFEADEHGVHVRVRRPVSFRKYVGALKGEGPSTIEEIVAEIREMRGE
jgi:AbrB family looped-hinge helix DNA binding protein